MKLPTSLRRLSERASRNVALRRRLPAHLGGGVLHVSPGAALCYYRGLEGPIWRELYDFAEHCVPRCGTVWDVGASMGVFAFAAAHVAGPGGNVLAVEADSWAVEFLKKSAAAPRTGAAPVQVLCAAVAGQHGIQGLDIPERGRAGSHLAQSGGAGGSLLGGTRESHPVVTLTLDWLAEKTHPPAVIKLDVEGAELAALQGGAHVLATHRPALFVEVHERNADATTALLHGHGYTLFDLSGGWANRTEARRALYNTLALPR